MRKAVESIKLDVAATQPEQTVAVAALLAAPMQQGFGENPTISRSHLGDLNPRPTVYETVALPLS
jgi:hypothetical protein